MTTINQIQEIPENVKCLSSRVKQMIIESFAVSLIAATNDNTGVNYDKLVNSIVFDSLGKNCLKGFKSFSNSTSQFVIIHLSNYDDLYEHLVLASYNNIVSAYNNNLASKIPVSMISFPRDTYKDIEYEVFSNKVNTKVLTLNVKAYKNDGEALTGTYYIDTSTSMISVSESLIELKPQLVWEKVAEDTDINGDDVVTEDNSGDEVIGDEPTDNNLENTDTTDENDTTSD